MWEVSVFGDDFEAGDGFGVADDVVEVDGAVFFDPVAVVLLVGCAWCCWISAHSPRQFIVRCCSIRLRLEAIAGTSRRRLCNLYVFSLRHDVRWLMFQKEEEDALKPLYASEEATLN